MASYRTELLKKLLKKHQGVSCFPLPLTLIAFLTTFFLLSIFTFTPSKIIIPQSNPIALITNSSSSFYSACPPIAPMPTTTSSSPPQNSLTAGEVRQLNRKGRQKKAKVGGRRRRKRNVNGGDNLEIKRERGNGSSCDLFDGRWVEDEKSPIYEPGSCPFVEEAFDCFRNGRPDLNYTRLRWRPNHCSIPRLDGRKLLEMLRGKRLAFVGDSLNRNMWESLLCILRNSLLHKEKVHELSGKSRLGYENSYAFKFTEYNSTIEFFRTPFLVQEWDVSSSNGTQKETLRLDMMEKSSSLYKNANVIIFNSAHWWTHKKTSKGENFYQEGDLIHSKLSAAEAYHKALITWARWVDEHVDPKRTIVFFRSYSWSHFSGGQWNSGGSCDGEIRPITDDKHLSKYPNFVNILSSVISGMRTPVLNLNITRMTDYRKDAHPSLYRLPKKKRQLWEGQDCSHWCLPGVPDAWNELMYAMLLKRFRR